ncbi:YncE family protein [Carboxylicivirga caseinilyticus]|uniref:YncE family protein n=1 Tax=Carboxylicivirga caseinilyticus TaxID=3417572 RepID=UPI003D3554DD|nr:hypothetical protein [Marinilabiliaceae bacterium A049]
MKFKNYIQLGVVSIILITALYGCSELGFKNDDSDDYSEEEENGITILDIDVSQLEIVSFTYHAKLKTGDSYNGVIGQEGAIDINMVATSDSTLMFITPYAAAGAYPIYMNNLEIDGLITIAEVEINDTPENIYNGFQKEVLSNIEQLNSTGKGMETVTKAYNLLDEYFNNYATDEEKYDFAVYYSSNHELFQNLFPLTSVASLKSDQIEGFKTSVVSYITFLKIAIVSGVATGVLVDFGQLELAIPTAVLTIIAAQNAYDAYFTASNSPVKVFESVVDRITEEFEQSLKLSTGVPLMFTIDEAEAINFHLRLKSVSEKDRTQAGFGDFFETFDRHNELIKELNGYITYLNDFNLVTIPLFDEVDVSEPDSIASIGVDQKMYKQLEFSLNTNVLSLNSRLIEEGVLEFTLSSATNEALEDSLESSITMYYSDELNEYTEEIPIKVYPVEETKEHVYVMDVDGEPRLIEVSLTTGRILNELVKLDDVYEDFIYLDESNRLICRDGYNQLIEISLTTGIAETFLAKPCSSLVYNPANNMLYAGAYDDQLLEIDIPAGVVKSSIEVGDGFDPTNIVLSEDGQKIIGQNNSGIIAVEIESQKVIQVSESMDFNDYEYIFSSPVTKKIYAIDRYYNYNDDLVNSLVELSISTTANSSYVGETILCTFDDYFSGFDCADESGFIVCHDHSNLIKIDMNTGNISVVNNPGTYYIEDVFVMSK